MTGPYPPDHVGQSGVEADQQLATALKDVRQTSTDLALSALRPHGAGTAAGGGAGVSSLSTQAVRIKAAADAGLSGGWGSPDSDTEGFGATAPDQATAMLASSPLSGAAPPNDAGTAATADAGAAEGAAAAGVGKPNDPNAPVPVFDDQGNPVLIPEGPNKG